MYGSLEDYVKILAIADKESKNLWDYYEPGKLEGIDLIISCGDLNPDYLQFLATFAHAPILYVHGNHDDYYQDHPPDGCICIEDKIYVHEGIRILGLGGSLRYKPGIHQYDQKEMRGRVKRLWFQLKKCGGFDILVTRRYFTTSFASCSGDHSCGSCRMPSVSQ